MGEPLSAPVRYHASADAATAIVAAIWSGSAAPIGERTRLQYEVSRPCSATSFPAAQRGADQVHVVEPPEVFNSQSRDRRGAADSRDIEDHVDAAEFSRRGRDRGPVHAHLTEPRT